MLVRSRYLPSHGILVRGRREGRGDEPFPSRAEVIGSWLSLCRAVTKRIRSIMKMMRVTV